MLINGGTNTMFDELDYSTLSDAVDGPQLMSFLPGIDVKTPPIFNQFVREV